jgi:rhodanese-related sulfurtransferase
MASVSPHEPYRSGRRMLQRVGLLASVVVPLLAGCGGEAPVDGGNPTITGVVTPQQLWASLFSAAPPRVIDVRDAADYELARIPRSSNDPCGCPLAAAQAAAAGDEIVIVGTTEQHARSAATAVLAPGEQAHVLQGGLAAWPYGLDVNDAQLNEWLTEGRALRLIDVRTPVEWQACRIDGTDNMPLDEIDTWAPTVDASEEIVLVCGSGARSAQARDTLAERGFTRVHNLLGGILVWRYGLVGDACTAAQ